MWGAFVLQPQSVRVGTSARAGRERDVEAVVQLQQYNGMAISIVDTGALRVCEQIDEDDAA